MHIFKKLVNKIILPGLLLVTAALNLQARQQDTLTNVQDSVNRVNDSRQKATGTVTDASTGKPLDGISISVSGYSASITNEKGTFIVSVPNYDAVLILSGLGFQTKEVALKGRTSVSVSLYEDAFTSVYDVARLPFRDVPFSRVTGAVNSLDVNDNWQRSSENAASYMQGRLPGLNVIRRSGTPGIGASLFLRGYTSLFTTNQPLIMVDGILYDNNDYGISLISGHVDNPLANIDLKDIDNITIIKDATASTYGVKAANGVILITTARAREQATRIDFAAFGGFNGRPSSIPVMGAGSYRTYLSDALGGYLADNGVSATQSEAIIQAQPYMNDDATNANYFRYHYDTDWQDKVISNTYNQTYYMKVTGGDNIATYGLAVGYQSNKGIIRNTGLERYQTRFNANLNLTTKLKGNANLSFVSNEQELKDQGLANNTNPIYLSLTKSPFLPAREVSELGLESPNYADVDIFNRSNPAAAVETMQGTNKNYRFQGSVGFDYEFTKQLRLQVLGGITYSKVRENIFIPEKGFLSDTLSQGVARNRSGSNVERLYSIFTDTRLSFDKTFDNTHTLSTNVGFRFNDNKMEADYGLGYNSATDDYVTVGQGQAILRQISGQNGSWRWLNMYANAGYDLFNKYFVNVNLAVDGSSRFGKNVSDGLKLGSNSFAVLPSVSAGWLISSENFLANNKAIELLKLRASYGLVGNDDIGNYTAKQYYRTQNFLGAQGLVRGNIPNTALKWESIEKFNIGLDASFLNERLNLTADLFNNTTHDMLVQEPVNTITGFDFAFSNNSGMKSNGVELGLNGRLLNKSIKWDMGLNVSTYKTEITKIPGDRMLTNYAGGTILTQKGLEGNLFYGYKTNGVYSTSAEATAANLASRRNDGTVLAFKAGDVRFVDTNGDNFIDEDDRQVIGNPNPDFVGMYTNTLSWKRFSFDAMFSFSKGNDIYNAVRRDLESMNGTQNQSPMVMNRWRAEGQVTNVPRATFGDPNENSRFSDRWIEDGSYIRLRTISLSYDVPFNAKALKYAKLYLIGNNVFTSTKYLGYDPEFSATNSVFTQGIDTGLEPQFRTVQLGVRIGL
ncbi:SusC/RagA family TonB-linked outer membrane protein [Pedobacter sp. P351]|uniref:SusC/RagA family TonB-linked outer membrane protein n=1 Tax=Pedobacter superstes TaxID=3133441 RepID=UPI0030ADE46E